LARNAYTSILRVMHNSYNSANFMVHQMPDRSKLAPTSVIRRRFSMSLKSFECTEIKVKVNYFVSRRQFRVKI